MSSNIQNILDEEFKLLIRATRNELFHFISVQYNHYDLVRKVKNDLVAQYLKRPNHSFNLDNCNPETFISDLLASKSGLVFIEKFDLIFTEPFRSLCIGFNQRRDLFSTLPIQIIVFIPSGEENLQNFQKAMPDVFSIVNPIIQLVQEIEVSEFGINNFESNEYNFANIEDSESEIKRIEKRLKILENTPENAKLIMSLKINLAKSYRFIGEYVKSKLLLEETLIEFDAINKIGYEDEIGSIQNELALVQIDLGDYENAKKLLEKISISAELRLGKNHSTTAVRYSNLAVVLRYLRNYEGAKKLFEKVIISDETNFGAGHPSTVRGYSNLATVLRDLGDYEGAKKLFKKVIILNITNFGEKHPITAISFSNLASVLRDLGDYEVAKKLLEKATISDEINFGEKHPNTAVSYSNLALVLEDLEDYENAFVLLEKSYTIFQNHLGDEHPYTIKSKENLDEIKERIK